MRWGSAMAYGNVRAGARVVLLSQCNREQADPLNALWSPSAFKDNDSMIEFDANGR